MDRKIKVVMVDDNTDFLFTMETFLKRNGFEVYTADNGKEGVDLILRETPDVVLLDVMMEALFTGFEVCKEVRNHPNLKETPIIGISGMADEIGVKPQQYEDNRYFSPDVFLDKPVDKTLLLKTIDEILIRTEKRKSRPQWQKEKEQNRIEKLQQ